MSDPQSKDDITETGQEQQRFDGHEFLSHLRGQIPPNITTDETLRTGNKKAIQTQLSDLFDSPAAPRLRKGETVTDNTVAQAIPPSQQQLQPQQLGLQQLFMPHPPPVSNGATDAERARSVSSSRKTHTSQLSNVSDLFDSPMLPRSTYNLGALPPTTKHTSSMPNNNNDAMPIVPPPPPPLPSTIGGGGRHNRTVSWGQGPVPPDNNSSQDESRESFQEQAHSSSSPGSRRSLTKGISIRDLFKNGTYEQEAETNILKAIEGQMDMGLRPRSDTLGSILSHVPDSTPHEFEHSSSDDNNTSSLQASSQEQHQPQQNQSTNGSLPTTNGSGSRSDEPPRDVPDAIVQPLLTRTSNHRRVLSIDQTLAGLTNAMATMKQQNTKTHGTSSDAIVGARTPLKQKPPASDPTAPQPSHDMSSSGDRFADAAVLLTQVGATPSMRRLDTLPESNYSGHGSAVADNDEEDSRETEPDVENPDGSSNSTPKLRPSLFRSANYKLKEDLETWSTFFHPRRQEIVMYVQWMLLYLILPALGVSAILFYLGGNPPSGKASTEDDNLAASASWWVLFVCVRQSVTFSLAMATQMILIDFLGLGTRVLLRLIGPILTLLIVQSKGWPFIFFWWGILDFALLYGDRPFATHWAYWQSSVDLFNESNPSGNVLNSEQYRRLLLIVVTVSIIVAVKRFLVGLYLGRQTFAHFGEQLARLMQKMLLVGEVAQLAKRIELSATASSVAFPVPSEYFGLEREFPSYTDDENTDSNTVRSVGTDGEKVIDTQNRDPLTGNLQHSERIKLMQLLEQWEEPDRNLDLRSNTTASIAAVLRFRKALTFIQKSFPFTLAFGPADTRENCIDSAQRVYTRLLLHNPTEPVLQFETLARLAYYGGGKIDQEKARRLVKLFRPDRAGRLTMLDFIKTVDSVYKQFRFLQASILNSSQIDQAFENILNVLFYIIMVSVILSQLGFNPLALFLSLSSVILAFAFMIGSASAKYFEGLLFILVRRPYGIGDFIHVSNIESETSFDGSPGWIVEHVTLFETIVTWAPTQERASLSNGSLSSSRIINWARSPQAQFHVFLNFPIDTGYEKIVVFKRAVEEFMKVRPREWIALNGFRAHKIFTEAGYVQYVVVIQHRDRWQQIGQVMDSKANLISYCMEVMKQLDMHYRAPPLPVHLNSSQTMVGLERLHNETTDRSVNMVDGGSTNDNEDDKFERFRSIALTRHNIRLN